MPDGWALSIRICFRLLLKCWKQFCSCPLSFCVLFDLLQLLPYFLHLGHKPAVRDLMAANFKGSQIRNMLTVVYNEEALMERRKNFDGKSHSRGTGTVKQTEGFLVITSPGCPKLQKRPNINHEGSTAGDALMQVAVPTEEFPCCILLCCSVFIPNLLFSCCCLQAVCWMRSQYWTMSVEKKKTCLKDMFFTASGRALGKDEAPTWYMRDDTQGIKPRKNQSQLHNYHSCYI